VSEEVAYEKARITVAQIDLDIITEREQVQRLLGTHGEDTNWRIKNELSAVSEQPTIPENTETRALEASLDLMEAKHRLEGLARRAGVTRVAGWLPDITIDFHSLQGNPEEDTNASNLNRNWRFGGGLTVGIPLFDRKQGTLVAVEAQFDALMESYYGMAVDLRSAVREARSRVASSHARAHQYQEVIVPAQRRVTEQTLLQYNAMQIGIFHLLQARREQLDVQLAYVETLREYWSAVAELDALLAGGHVSSPHTRASRNITQDTKNESSRGH
jgi:outer membrane protein TolC